MILWENVIERESDSDNDRFCALSEALNVDVADEDNERVSVSSGLSEKVIESDSVFTVCVCSSESEPLRSCECVSVMLLVSVSVSEAVSVSLYSLV